jgi:hypothetical protein
VTVRARGGTTNGRLVNPEIIKIAIISVDLMATAQGRWLGEGVKTAEGAMEGKM